MKSKFSIVELPLEGAFVITPFVAEDHRGSFIKDYSKDKMNEFNILFDIQEVFYTTSKKGVIRAIHFQNVKQQAKLVRCIKGEVYDVIVDLRVKSKTFGKWFGIYLSEFNDLEIFVPKGFGHGYIVLEESIVSYKCDEKFYGEYDDGIIWNDIDLGINWPTAEMDSLILSEKDKNLQTFLHYKKNHLKGELK